MSKEKREPEYAAELETQFILRLPEEPAKLLREILRSGDNLKNHLTIHIDNDMRHGEVRFDKWVMHAKIVDLPTIVESLKTIDNKSFYKTADLSQMMICKEEPDQPSTEEDTPAKSKKKDPYKVDKKFLWPHGITPPTKNVRKRRFRKTLKKKYVESPEIEKEVKRLLRADNEAVSFTWELIKEEDEPAKPEPGTSVNPKPEKKKKAARNKKSKAGAKKKEPSSEVAIFGGAVSDSELEEENINVEIEDSPLSAYDSRPSDTSSMQGFGDSAFRKDTQPVKFDSKMFRSRKLPVSHTVTSATVHLKSGQASSEEENDNQPQDGSKENMTLRIEQLLSELEELKVRRQRTKLEITGLENPTLKQRFQDILHTLNRDVMYKEMEYQGLLTLQNSEDI